ncbi:hypothetical protein TgHK011_007666 [Trichoderma gracile]|nr:hypothetical protein TgHK011_007666 [Trichoderma gracile]
MHCDVVVRSLRAHCGDACGATSAAPYKVQRAGAQSARCSRLLPAASGDANPSASPSISCLCSLCLSGCICKAAVQPPSGTATRAQGRRSDTPADRSIASRAQQPQRGLSHRFAPFQFQPSVCR